MRADWPLHPEYRMCWIHSATGGGGDATVYYQLLCHDCRVSASCCASTVLRRPFEHVGNHPGISDIGKCEPMLTLAAHRSA